MNEEAKSSMEHWQSKLEKVTDDSQSRINELQDKLNKVRFWYTYQAIYTLQNHIVGGYVKWLNKFGLFQFIVLIAMII